MDEWKKFKKELLNDNEVNSEYKKLLLKYKVILKTIQAVSLRGA